MGHPGAVRDLMSRGWPSLCGWPPCHRIAMGDFNLASPWPRDRSST